MIRTIVVLVIGILAGRYGNKDNLNVAKEKVKEVIDIDKAKRFATGIKDLYTNTYTSAGNNSNKEEEE